MGDARARWATAWRAVRTLHQGGRAALEAAMVLQSDRLMGGSAILLAMAAPDQVGRRASIWRAVESLTGLRPIPAAHLLDARMLRRAGVADWRAVIAHPRLPLAALDRPRCRVCGFACRPDGWGCQPDLCRSIGRPAWPKGHTPCAP